jgi:putative ABC transport system permease protein
MMSVDVELPSGDYREWERVEQFYSRLLAALRARPEIATLGASNFLPLEAGWRIPFVAESAPPVNREQTPLAQYHTVDEGYFPALGVRLLRGRNFSERDRSDGVGVVIINEAMARQFWPGQDPVGKRLESYARGIGPLGRRINVEDTQEIIGVVADVKNTSLKSVAEPSIYSTFRQFPFSKLYLVIRPRADDAAVLSVVRDEVRRLDPNVALGESRPLERVLAQTADPPRFVMLLMSVFALLALALAAVGIYGILSYNVSQRTRELGVRMALGARPTDVVQLVAREGVGLAVLGALLGAVGAGLGGRFLAVLLYGVQPVDPVTLTVVCTLVVGVAVLACVAPARRAAAADPVGTFRG